jgi:hypothetical protein
MLKKLNIMNPPKMTDKTDVCDYIDEFEKYKIYIKKTNYDIVLNFFNKMLKLKEDTEYKALTDIQNIHKSRFLNCKKLLKNNKDIFKKNFDMDIDVNKLRTFKNTDKNKDIEIDYIVRILRKALRCIDYSMPSTKKLYYAIKVK